MPPSELALKVALSLLAVSLCIAVGWKVAHARPFDVPLVRGGPVRGSTPPSAGLPRVPGPPQGELTFRADTPAGRHERYQTQLDPDAVR